MKIFGSPGVRDPQAAPSQRFAKDRLGHLAKYLCGCFSPGCGMPGVDSPNPHVAELGHYPKSLAGSSEGGGSQETLTRLNDTPLKRALGRELDRFGYGTPVSEAFTAVLKRKDASPALTAMPDDEYLALRFYTTPFYKSVNHQARSGVLSEDMRQIIDSMERGLKLLGEDPQNVSKGTLYRGINTHVSDKFIHQSFQLHEVYRDKTFVSASADPTVVSSSFTRLSVKNEKSEDIGTRYQKSPLLEIESTSAVRIKPVSMSPSEQESLFLPNTPFRVMGKQQSESGRWHIKLREIDEGGSSS